MAALAVLAWAQCAAESSGASVGAGPTRYRPVPRDALPPTPPGQVWTLSGPDEFLVDYVRVYDLIDAVSGEPAMKPKPFGKRSPGPATGR
jgi:hypothetical protein